MTRARLVMAVLALTACSSPKSLSRKTDAKHPAPTAWSEATLEMVYEPGGGTLTSSRSESVTYFLDLRGASPLHFALEHFYTGGMPGDVSSARTAAMRKGPERLVFAPDGHALAMARAGESVWRYIALDAADAPLYCRHVSFGDDANPFAGAPSTRDLAIAILGTSVRGTHDPDVNVPSHDGFESELQGAARFACAHRDDAALREAVITAIVVRGSRLFSDSVKDPIVQCAGETARAHADLRSILITVVGEQDPAMTDQVARAARALAVGDDAASADAIAAALMQPAASRKDSAGGCWVRAAMTWSLARMTSARGSASKAALDALTAIARTPEPCGSGAPAARAYAVRGLAAAPSVESHRVLHDLADGSCVRPVVTWPVAYETWNEGMPGDNHEIACWAQAALAASVRGTTK